VFEVQIDLQNVPTNPAQPVLSGETWGFQCWHRDGSGVSNFTRRLQHTFL
jgi:hypothetical protein